MPSIRPVTPDDAVAMAELLTQLGYSTSTEQLERRLVHWLDVPDSVVLIAEHDAKVLGCLSLHANPYLIRDGKWARIESLVVEEGARGTGVGRALIDAAEEQARQWGCVSMEVTSAQRRVDAHAFYERMGYVLSVQMGRFWKPLA